MGCHMLEFDLKDIFWPYQTSGKFAVNLSKLAEIALYMLIY